MKVVRQLEIEGKKAELLLSDNDIVQIIYGGDIISTSGGSTWNNIKSEEWAQSGLIKIEVEKYIKRQKALNTLNKLAKLYF